MDAATRKMINSLTEDILHSLNIQIPVKDIDKLVDSLGGTIQPDLNYSDGAVKKNGDSFIILVSPFQDEKKEKIYNCA